MAEQNKYVIDTSALLAILLPDERTTKEALNFLTIIVGRTTIIHAPRLLEFEFGNALKSAVIRKRLDEGDVSEIFYRYKKLPIKFFEVNFLDTVEISLKSGLSYYDASYLFLAQKLNAKLLTLDKKLKVL